MKPQMIVHKNATEVKLTNKRIMVINDNGNMVLQFKFIDKENPNAKRCGTKIFKDKLLVTEFGLTQESAQALMYCLMEEFKKIHEAETETETDLSTETKN